MSSLLLRCVAVVMAPFMWLASAAAGKPERIIIFTNSSRDLEEFRAFAKSASRMKRHGKVEIDIGVLAEKASFELPPGGNEWHQYAAFNASLSKFFPHPKIAPFWPREWVAKNRDLLLAKAAILREYGLGAALSSNDTHYLPEAFFERYPALRGPRVDHPRRSRREEFSFCVDLPETLEMIEGMTAEAKRNAHAAWLCCPELAANCRIQHPERQLQSPTGMNILRTAVRHSDPALHQRGMHSHLATKPRMPRIADFSHFNNMGVVLLTCTTWTARTPG